MEKSLQNQLKIIKRGTVEIIPEKELEEKLEKSIRENTPLKVKLGIDPTTPDIHLGHTVVLRKLKHFVDLGHEGILVIGDFTATIGDPSGRDKTRPILTREQVRENAKTYLKQVSKILDIKKIKIVYNSEWFAKMNFEEVLSLVSRTTVARLLEREDFSLRYKKGNPIGLHEFIYPIMQAYDSVILKADVEIGATDQTFNIMMGRQFQKEYGLSPQVGITMPILVGLDGKMKMSKSLGNYIGIRDTSNDMFGKVMSIPDELIVSYAELLTEMDIENIKNRLKEGENPRNLKVELAEMIVSIFYDEQIAKKCKEEFERVFKKKEVPEDIPIIELSKEDAQEIWIVELLKRCGFCSSTSEARRIIQQGGVKIDDKKIVDWQKRLIISSETIIKYGKRRYCKVVVK